MYFGQPVNEALLEPVKAELEKGMSALSALAQYSPYIAGDDFGFADIDAYFQIRFASLHTKKIYDWDLVGSDSKLSDYISLVGERPSIKSVDDTLQRDFAAFQSK